MTKPINSTPARRLLISNTSCRAICFFWELFPTRWSALSDPFLPLYPDGPRYLEARHWAQLVPKEEEITRNFNNSTHVLYGSFQSLLKLFPLSLLRPHHPLKWVYRQKALCLQQIHHMIASDLDEQKINHHIGSFCFGFDAGFWGLGVAPLPFTSGLSEPLISWFASGLCGQT